MKHRYTVEKYPYRQGWRWQVLQDGQPVGDGVAWSGGKHCETRRKALKAAVDFAARDDWRALVFADDLSGDYHWTPEEFEQIADFAKRLRENPLRWTFSGQLPLRRIARDAHQKDARDLLKPDSCWIDPSWVRAETRRSMAARREAFRQAGLDLEGLTQEAA